MQILNFLYLKKIIVELKRKTIFASMCFVIKMIWFILSMYQMKKIEKCIDLLLEKKNTVVELLFKKLFCRYCLQCFSSNKFLLEHKTFS